MDEPVWEPHDIGRFADRIENALRHQGKQARSRDARNSAFRRVSTAINQLGPHLFPLIAAAEKKVIGTRPVPMGAIPVRCSNYEVHGIIDVLTHVTLGNVASANLIKECVEATCPGLHGEYEVIVDYKGSLRPLVGGADNYWNQGSWQLETYSWLRSKQPDSMPVAAGILIYVNELTPGTREMQNLKEGIRRGMTDVLPEPGSRDEQIVRMWRPGNAADQLSLQFRLRRAIRVVPITEQSTLEALAQFDGVVRRAEENIIAEAAAGSILQTWETTGDDATCDACDFRWFCPKFGDGDGPRVEAP